MKNLYKSLAFAAIAAMTLISCNKEPQPVEQPGPKTGATVIEFNAQVADPGTKATLTPNEGETEFTAAWEGNDELRLIVSSSSDTEETTATWDATKSVFSAAFQDLSGQNTWTYKAIWPVPSKDGIDFGSGRVQNGNAYNSAYDVMFGSKSVTAEIGMESDNETPLVVPMNRLTGIAYFHITSSLPDGEKVVSATLKANNIAAETVSVNTASGTLVVPETKLNEITITFEAGTAPSAQNFQLWFNVLPGSYSGIELTIVTDSHTATLKPTATFTYTAGKLNKAVLSGLNWKKEPQYEKVTSTVDLTAGDYLIVNEAEGVAFDGSLETLDAGHNVISVTISNNAVLSTEDVDASIFTIVPLAEGYSIRSASGFYIGKNASGNGMDTGDTALTNAITFDDNGNAVITGAGGSLLRFNKSTGDNNYRFRYYGSGQQVIALYKLDDGKEDSGIAFATTEFTFVRNSTEYNAFEGQPATLATGNNAAITYAMTGDEIGSIDVSTGAVELNGNIGTATVIATVAPNGNFRGGEASYTITVENSAKTLSQITGPEAGVTVKNVTVMATDGNKNYIIKDATGLGLLYGTYTLDAGSYLNSLVGDVVLYDANNILEFKENVSFDVSSTSVTVNHGTAAEFSSVAAALEEEPAVVYVHALGTKEGRDIAVGENSLYLSANSNISDGPVEVYGYLIGYNSTHTNHTILATSLSEYIDPDEPSLCVDKNELTWLYNETNAQTVNITLNTNGSVTKVESNMSWASVSLSNNVLTVTPNGENTSTTQDNQGTITLTHGSDNTLVEVITCTQSRQINYITKSVSFTPGDSGNMAASSNNGGTGTKKGVTVTIEAGGDGPSYINIYKSKTMTISAPEHAVITEIVFTCTANGTAQYGPGSMTLNNGQNGSYTASSGKTGSWEGTSSTVTFTANNNQIRMTSIAVTFMIDEAYNVTDPTTISLSKGETSSDPIIVQEGSTVDLANYVTTNNTTGTKSYSTTVSSTIATLDGSVITGVGAGEPFVVTLSIGATDDYSAATKNIYVSVAASSNYTPVPQQTFSFSQLYSSNTTLDGVTINGTYCSLVFNKREGGTATQYYTNGSAVRWYGGGTLAITAPTGYKITSIKISYSQTANTVSTDTGTYALSNNTGTWSGEIANGTTVTFTQSGTSGHCRITSIEIN